MIETIFSPLQGTNLTVAYGERTVLSDVDVHIPAGEFTVIVGPNACGKSTLLRALSRMLEPQHGTVFLEGADIRTFGTKEVARMLALLPQHSTVPGSIVVEDLVARGRYPHQSLFQQWSAADQEAVDRAMQRANISDLAQRQVTELSGGQRQRVWLALVLAQDTQILLLDEPTTYLDITHQVEVLNLARGLQREGITVVAVLHELTLAFRYASNLILMKDGAIVATGAVNEVVTPERIREVYDLECDLLTDPRTGRPIVVPID